MAMARLTRQIVDTAVLGLDRETIDETAQGGRREQLDLSIDGREHHFVAENTDPPPFRSVVKLLWGVMFSDGQLMRAKSFALRPCFLSSFPSSRRSFWAASAAFVTLPLDSVITRAR